MEPEQQGPAPDRKDRARLVGAVVVVALIVGLVLDNRHEVPIGYIVGEAEVRLIWLLLVTAILGAVAALLFRRRRR